MGLTQEYRKDVEHVQEAVTTKVSAGDALSLKKSLDNVLPFIFLLLGFIILFGFIVPVNQKVEIWINWANYTVLSYFAVRLAVEYKLSGPNDHFLKEHWMDILMVIPAFSLVQEAKFFQLFEESLLARFSPEVAASSASFRSTTVAAKLTRISRMIKRSVGF